AVAGPDQSGPLGYGWQFITQYQVLPTAQRAGVRMNTLMDRNGPEAHCTVRMREKWCPSWDWAPIRRRAEVEAGSRSPPLLTTFIAHSTTRADTGPCQLGRGAL
ncbi:hypothetical protein ACFRH8_34665, partial [Streptomyces sp. NPDC056707]